MNKHHGGVYCSYRDCPNKFYSEREVKNRHWKLLLSPSQHCNLNGYSLKMDYVKLCMDDSLVEPKNMNFTFDPNCNLVLNGCLVFKKTMKTAKAKYEVTKSPMPTITGDIDMCTLFTNSKGMVVAQQMIESYGLPKKCPVAAKNFCINGQKLISMSTYKNKLAMAVGTVLVKLNIDHDNGKSCIDIKITVSKKK